MKTKQQIFNQVWKYFVVNKNGPAYRVNVQRLPIGVFISDHNERCAIGCLIPKRFDSVLKRIPGGIYKLYAVALNNPLYSELSSWITANFGPYVPDTTAICQFLRDLQGIHDGAVFDSFYRPNSKDEFSAIITVRLVELARRHNLRIQK
jgi:hypothetical protein